MNVNPEIFDPLKGFAKVKKTACIPLWWVAVLVIGVLIVLLLCGCSPKVVTVPEVHTEHHYLMDTIREKDSVIDKQTTIIRQVDSATMAMYGIKLKAAEKAWLVQNDRLQREIERLQSISKQADSVKDEKPVPVPVEKKLTKWQQIKIRFTDYAIVAVIILVLVYLLWLRRRSQR